MLELYQRDFKGRWARNSWCNLEEDQSKDIHRPAVLVNEKAYAAARPVGSSIWEHLKGGNCFKRLQKASKGLDAEKLQMDIY